MLIKKKRLLKQGKLYATAIYQNKVIENLSKFKNKKFLERFLTSLGYSSPNDILIQDLSDLIGKADNEEVRETASYSLCKLLTNTASPPLSLLSCSSPSPSCLRKMINCITAMKAEGRFLGNILTAAQQTESQTVREMAIRALG